jgi:hypothetical protein
MVYAVKHRIRGLIRWPETILGPRPGLKELNVVCWGLFVAGLVMPVTVYLWIRYKSGAKFSDLLPIDFIYYYGVGRLLNEHSAANLYDYGLQLKTFNDIYPLHQNHEVWGRSPYPPFVAQFFSLFARLSLQKAYFLWMGTSLGLYIAGITATAKVAFPREPLKNSVVFCFSLSFPVFLYYNLVVGQLATVAVFSLGLAIYLERRSTLFASGLALSILTYKPTLLLLIIPMLLVTRRFRPFFGFMAGAAALILASTCSAGVRIWPAYAQFLSTFAGTAGINGVSIVKRWQYIDFNSFSYAIPGGRTRLGLAILIATMLCITAWLIALLRRSAGGDGAAQKLAWAVTVTWTLLLNVYVPIYDTILIAVAVPLTLSALGDLGCRKAAGWVSLLAVGVFAISISTEGFARIHGIQPLTILLLLLGLGQAILLERAVRLGSPRQSPALVAS